MRFFRIFNNKKIKNKVVHLMMMEKFTEPYVRTINSLFPVGENDFVIYGGPVHKGIELHCLKEKNVWTVMNGYLFGETKYRNFLLSHKKIIIHGLFEAGIIQNWSSDKELLQKTYIFLYGAYPSAERIEDSNYYKIIQNAAGIINIYKTENKLVEELYHPNGKLFDAFYMAAQYSEFKKNKSISNDTLKIQIGNSATESMQHLKIIDLLSKFRNENIEVYAPLSYGNKEYADIVEAYGKEMLGDKFVSIRGFMPKEKYVDFITHMGIAVFGTQQQQASDNMDINLWSGNCLYLPKESIMAKIYEEEMDCKIKYIEDVKYMSFEQFRLWTEQEGDANSEKILRFYSNENFVNKWKYIFDFPMIG